MKVSILLLFFSLASHQAFSQQHSHDSIEYVFYTDKFGNQQKAPVVQAHQVLIVNGEKMFFVPDESTLNTFLKLNQNFDIIHNPDSLKQFFKKHIKAVIVIKNKEK